MENSNKALQSLSLFLRFPPPNGSSKVLDWVLCRIFDVVRTWEDVQKHQ
jgi:hypothetical protein